MKIQLPEKVSCIIDQLMKHGYEAYAVGGCVRDSLLGRVPDDWDITTSALPEQIKALFSHTVDTGIQHGTVTVLIGKDGFEVTTYRIDGEYEDSRHPKEVTFTQNLVEDLKRRDFTINAMAYNDKAGLVDVFDGIGDLERRQIRCVGIAKERFTEDALRVLRAVRFSAQLGFAIEDKTKQAMEEMAGNLANISAERIQVELVKLLVSPHPDTLRVAYELGITKVVLPEFDEMMDTTQENPHHIYSVGEHTLHALMNVSSQKCLRLAMLLHDSGKPETKKTNAEGISYFEGHAAVGEQKVQQILRRLKFDNDTLRRVKRLVKWHDYRFKEDERSMRHSLYEIGPDLFEDLLEVMRADVMAQSRFHQKEKLEQLGVLKQRYLAILDKKQCLSLKALAIDGKALIELGLKPGPEIGKMLNILLMMVLDDPEKNEKEILIAKVKEAMM